MIICDHFMKLYHNLSNFEIVFPKKIEYTTDRIFLKRGSMKLERINENQIRCTLNLSDLQARHVSPVELAYGTEKARKLFDEMMEHALHELGFEANGTPLMIEATPVGGNSLVLVITKIDDPEELDTRFSKFAPSIIAGEGAGKNMVEGPARISADDLLQAISRLEQENEKEASGKQKVQERTFVFRSRESISAAAKILNSVYHGENALYFKKKTGCYYLIARQGNHTPEEFNRICNILTEYGQMIRDGFSSEAYFAEHYETVFRKNALHHLAGG